MKRFWLIARVIAAIMLGAELLSRMDLFTTILYIITSILIWSLEDPDD